MGYQRHHAITVTCHSERDIKIAHDKAIEIFGTAVTNVVEQDYNYSFMVVPDGSYEGYDESYEGDRKRSLFVKWINEQADPYDGGSNSIRFCEFYYGDENGHSAIVNHN